MKFARCILLVVFALGFAPLHTALGADPPPAQSVPSAVWSDPRAPVEARVNDLLPRLTQPEKLSLLALDSNNNPQKLDTPPIPRLGIPSLRTSDAPEGLRDGLSTAFPMEIVMAATWDTALIHQVGAAIGEEALARNRQVVYGPCLNIQRSPQGGRDFENFSEDPFLTAQLGVADISGLQSRRVAACPKHFVCNDQEVGRHDVDIQVDERTLREIYLPPFHEAVRRAHAWSLMSSLSRVNGTFAAQNRPLITGLLKQEWGWDGMEIGDWGAIHDTAQALNAGTDMEMPTPAVFSAGALSDALAKGTITQVAVDEAVRRILRLMARTGLLDGPRPALPPPADDPAHDRLALRVAREGITLLKNARSILPLSRRKGMRIAVIGPNAQDTQLGGRWSADVTPFHRVGVLDGLQAKSGPGLTVTYAQGCPRTGPSTPADLAAAVTLAAHSDVAIVVVGMDNNYEGEEMDPPNLSLPGDQDKLIAAVAAANPHTIVVLNNGTPILMPWLPHIAGLVEAWYSGQEQGTAVADVLFGDINPSGHLPQTLARRREDYSDWGFYPSVGGVLKYGEGLYVGYRHFDKAHITPLFPFGFGLSYTTFAFSGLQVPATLPPGAVGTVRVVVRNTGKRAGAEVVQMYVRDLAPKIDRPVRELKGFARVSLRPGQSATVTLPLDTQAFSYWDVGQHRWQANPGAYAVEVGPSSRELSLQGVIRLK